MKPIQEDEYYQTNCVCNCDCGNSLKPASYKNGLYRSDYRVYNASFLILTLFSIHADSIIYSLSFGYYGCYLPTIGLSLTFIASLFIFYDCSKSPLLENMNILNKTRGLLFIIGGLLYFIGYIIHSFTTKDICDDDDFEGDSYDCSTFFWNDITPEPVYLVGRGIFVGSHSLFIGLLYFTNNKPRYFHLRGVLTRIWSIFFMIFSISSLCALYSPIYINWPIYVGPTVITFTMILNIFLIKCEHNHDQNDQNQSCCNIPCTLSLISSIFYYFSVMVNFSYLIVKTFGQPSNDKVSYFFWEFGLIIFGAMHMGILTRSIHPCGACCCQTEEYHQNIDHNQVEGMKRISISEGEPTGKTNHTNQKENNDLPDEWQKCFADDGRTYYQNNITKVTQWEIPT